MPAERDRAPRPEIVVVGGGVAGLSAATSLAARGARVILIEARPTLGGRARSFVDPPTQSLADNGQHVLMGCYDEAFTLMRRIGSEPRAVPQRSLAMDVVDGAGRASKLSCPSLPSPVHLLAGVLRWNALGLADGLSVLHLARRSAPHASETVAMWLSRMRQADRLIEMLWEPLALAALNQPIHVAAAGPFVAVLDRLLRGRSASALVVPRAPLSDLFGNPARDYLLRRQARILTGSPARLVFGSDGTPTVVVRQQTLSPAAVIVCVEWHALPRVVVNPPQQLADVIRAAAGTPAEAIVSAHLWFDKPVMRAPFVGLPGRAWQWVFDVGAAWSGCRPDSPSPPERDQGGRVSLVASGASHVVARSNDELRASALEVLHDAVPESRHARLLRAVVVRERFATFSVAPEVPSRPGHDVGVPGLYLAGDWIGNPLPATIEAAALSGHRAAELAARNLGL